MTEEEALEKALQASMAENSGPKENVVKEPKVTVKPLSKMKDESKKQIKNSRKSMGKESGRKTRQSKTEKFKDSETAKLWANVPESKGNIHILRKHLY